MDQLDEGRKLEAGTSPALNTQVAPTADEKEEAAAQAAQPEADPVTEPAQADACQAQAEEGAPTQPDAGAETADADPNPAQLEDSQDQPGVSEGHALSQEQVNDLVGKTRGETRERTFRYIYDRYGVQDEAGLDELVGNAQRYDSLSEKYDADRKAWEATDSQRSSELDELREKVALMSSGIDPARYDDAKYIIKGKGLKVGDDTVAAELQSHPEWRKQEPVAPAKPESRISVLGNEKESAEGQGESEEERAMRMFRV